MSGLIFCHPLSRGTWTITPNLDRILETDEHDMRQLVIQDLTVLLLNVHKKYGFIGELPKAE